MPSVSTAVKSVTRLSHCTPIRFLTIVLNEINCDLPGYEVPLGPQVCIRNADTRGRAAQMCADETNEDRGGVELSQISCLNSSSDGMDDMLSFTIIGD